jgi:iron(III) transport system substrate-binding protein
MSPVSRRAFISRTAIAGVGVTLGLAAGGCVAPAYEVVVYTSLDQPISEPILKAFEATSGARVKAVYDAEAAKTTGLVSRLAAERDRPRADVFWSSEYAQTLRLAADGLLDRYDSPAARDIPAAYRDPERRWTGFAARARVLIANTRLVPDAERPRSIFDLLDRRFAPGDVAIANPLFGTSATHAAALHATLGPVRARDYYTQLRERGARFVEGNSVVRDLVVAGSASVGLTDTDDAQAAVDRGEPVAVVFPDQSGADALGALVIPNTVALVRGAPNPTLGRKLIDYLLGPDVEAALARSGSAQMPVRPGVPLPSGVPPLDSIRPMAADLNSVAARYSESSTWLRETFLR